jgi:predicted nuclease with TOPRIM domain
MVIPSHSELVVGYKPMTQEIHKEAFKQAEKELLESRIKEIKGYILETLEKIESKKKEKERIEEELRVLKLDLEDLRNGKFDKIEERIKKSELARNTTAIRVMSFYSSSPIFTNPNWIELTSGTYTLGNGTSFYF